MSAKVDVLAVLDASVPILSEATWTGEHGRELEEARAAVAELIVAAGNMLECVEIEGFSSTACDNRIRAALAACGVKS